MASAAAAGVKEHWSEVPRGAGRREAGGGRDPCPLHPAASLSHLGRAER